MGRRIFLRSLALVLIISAAHATGHGVQAAAVVTLQGMDGGVGSSNSMMRTMVGSRPPVCEGRCWWCGGRRCVAVQVPITPQQEKKKIPHRQAHGGMSSSALMQKEAAAAAYDDRSNYKPLSWRCKCGRP